jgi:hypothetical protein
VGVAISICHEACGVDRAPHPTYICYHPHKHSVTLIPAMLIRLQVRSWWESKKDDSASTQASPRASAAAAQVIFFYFLQVVEK